MIWNIFFPYIWNNHPNRLIFFRVIETTNQPLTIVISTISSGTSNLNLAILGPHHVENGGMGWWFIVLLMLLWIGSSPDSLRLAPVSQRWLVPASWFSWMVNCSVQKHRRGESKRHQKPIELWEQFLMFIDEDGKWMEMDMISQSKLGLFWSVVIRGTPSIQYTQLETVTMIQLYIRVHSGGP